MTLSSVIQIIFLSFIIVVLQIFIPSIIVKNLEITPDLLIIFLVYIGYYYGRFETVIIGFLFGFVQDLLTQLELIGVMTFSKSLVGYLLGTTALYRNIWNKNFRLFFIFILFILHFFIYYYIKLNGINIALGLFITIIIFQSSLCYIILLIIDKIIMNNSLSK